LRERLRTSAKAWLAAIAALALAVALLLAWVATLSVSRTPETAGPGPGLAGSGPETGSGPEENKPPLPQATQLEQFKPSGDALPTGGETPGGVLTAVTVAGGSADAVIDVEVKPAAEPFDGAGLRSWPAGDDHKAMLSHDLPPGPFHWRARTRNGERATGWTVYDPAAQTHFIVVAALAKAPPPPPGAGAGVMSGAGDEGESRPLPSIVDDRSTIWDLLRPFALVLAGLGAAAVAAAVLAQRGRARPSRGRVR
jgi:hypothetical protein